MLSLLLNYGIIIIIFIITIIIIIAFLESSYVWMEGQKEVQNRWFEQCHSHRH